MESSKNCGNKLCTIVVFYRDIAWGAVLWKEYIPKMAKEALGMLITNGPLITFDSDRPFIELGAVRIREGRISDVGDAKSIQEESGEKVLDAEGRLILPGLIDAHTHLYSGFARGIPLNGEPPSNFIEILERLWWRVDSALEM